jgi:hypothetical protein
MDPITAYAIKILRKLRLGENRNGCGMSGEAGELINGAYEHSFTTSPNAPLNAPLGDLA